jgi:hypothetical protein
MFAATLRKLLPGLWFGVMAAIALIVMPAAFATLDTASAGALARRVFAAEAGASLAFGIVVLMLERRHGLARHHAAGTSQFTTDMLLAVGALFCTVAGYYGLQPMMETVRAGGTAPLGFGQLHALSTAFFGLKGLLVLALAWRAASSPRSLTPSSSR